MLAFEFLLPLPLASASATHPSSSMASFSTTISVPLLPLLLLLCQAALLLGKSHCPPSSCGDIHIKLPFRLSGDPHGCGDKRFELVCEENRAVYSDSHSEKYLVTEISYNNSTLRLMYSGLLSDTTCILPKHSFQTNELHGGSSKSGVCPYVAVPCLSGSSSTAYVVDNSTSYQLLYLKNSCSFLTTVPVENLLSPGDDIFKLLRKGFLERWIIPIPTVKMCWEEKK